MIYRLDSLEREDTTCKKDYKMFIKIAFGIQTIPFQFFITYTFWNWMYMYWIAHLIGAQNAHVLLNWKLNYRILNCAFYQKE